MNYLYTKDMPPEDRVHGTEVVISAASQGLYPLFLVRRHLCQKRLLATLGVVES